MYLKFWNWFNAGCKPLIKVLFMWSNFCCNRNYNRNFQLCLFLIFASSFINRYPLYSVLLRKSNILQLQMLNYHLGQAQRIIKTSKINITDNFCYNFCYNRNWTRRIGLIILKNPKMWILFGQFSSIIFFFLIA